ncbi:hypothetical protein B0I35DRAFT_403210 [Stachybotrys elegans]|uniref:Uncharacterized protein n=1 Tax=Stachybotrys elegans TaxID=80388 RepID=A0A8K0SZY6_9HYPO|nr:hypothetical protein B0I35DRAFT_403210 [Stachybotrys elegans]
MNYEVRSLRNVRELLQWEYEVNPDWCPEFPTLLPPLDPCTSVRSSAWEYATNMDMFSCPFGGSLESKIRIMQVFHWTWLVRAVIPDPSKGFAGWERCHIRGMLSWYKLVFRLHEEHQDWRMLLLSSPWYFCREFDRICTWGDEEDFVDLWLHVANRRPLRYMPGGRVCMPIEQDKYVEELDPARDVVKAVLGS